MTTCKNCGYQSELKYCPNCGQKASVKRLEMKSLLQELPHSVFHIDKGFLFNVSQIIKRPGYAIKDYLDGKRKNFYHPLSYMLIVLGTMLVAMNLMKVHYYDPVQDAWMTPEKAASWKEYDATQQTWIHYYKFYIPFYLPWIALIFYLWLRVMKQAYTYAECIFISFFCSANMTIPQIIVLTLAYFVNNPSFTRTSDQVINNTVLAIIFFFQFYQLGNPLLKKGRRILLSGIGTLVLGAFTYTILYAFLYMATKIGL